MMPSLAAGAHEALLADGWVLLHERELGLDSRAFTAANEHFLVPDPRGLGKLRARDVITYERTDYLPVSLAECESAAHVSLSGEVTDGFSRFPLLARVSGRRAARKFLDLIPGDLASPAGRMSADYFRYGPGVSSEPHQDSFGDFVIIWVLDRSGTGCESFLITPGGRDVLRRELAPGEILAFRDEMFLHGVTELAGAGAFRDALICITLRDRM